MKQGLLLLALVGLPTHAAAEQVYLLATAGLNDTTMAQSIFLSEPAITDLQGCREALRQGQRHGDWLQYHHVLRKDRMQGFTVQMQYRCVTSRQAIEPWFDRARYSQPYLIRVDDQSRLDVRPMQSMAACMGIYRALAPDEQARSHCAKGNQRLR